MNWQCFSTYVSSVEISYDVLSIILFQVDSKNVQLKVDETGKPTGVAMVKFPSTKLALEAMEQKNEKYFLGRPLQLFLQNKLTS